jgi:hypothetical protein
LQAGGVAAVLLLVAISFAFGERSRSAAQPKGPSPDAFQDETGVEVVRVTLAAGGGMLDLRYRVLNPDKAVLVHDPKQPPRIILERTGLIVDRPWMAHHGAGEMHMAATYYELLINPGGIVKRGDAVTVAIGSARLAHVTVQ